LGRQHIAKAWAGELVSALMIEEDTRTAFNPRPENAGLHNRSRAWTSHFAVLLGTECLPQELLLGTPQGQPRLRVAFYAAPDMILAHSGGPEGVRELSLRGSVVAPIG
jgi:hypothetical protein